MATSFRTSSPATLLIDPVAPTRDGDERSFRFDPGVRAWAIPLFIAATCLVLSLVGWALPDFRRQFYFSYLVAWTFCVALSLGSLFFVMISHITRTRWAVVIRRIPEMLMIAFPLLALLSVPILIGMHDLYHWTHHSLYEVGGPEFDAVLNGKRPYLNTPFFLVRVLVYFVAWSLLSLRLYRLSVRQDVEPDPDIAAAQRKTSAWGIPLFAVTTAFFSYDLLMSLDPHWFSTIFGVYFFAGAYWSAIALITLMAIVIQRNSRSMRHVITTEHFHDLGKWLFAFTVFWAYIAFSQYMLIWYANLPEEILFYHHRLEHGWQVHSAILLFGHFVFPFFVLLPRFTKRTVPVLATMAGWALLMQWLDLHWLAMPVLRPERAGIHWLDVTCWVGLFGLFVALFFYRAGRHSIVPRHDPYLGFSLRFSNT